MALARRVGLLVVVVLAACSSGGGDSPPPPPAGLTLGGTIRAAAATDADGDTADPSAPQTQNDTSGTAQALPSAVAVGGWASAAADADDWFRAALAAGQAVTLDIADVAAADLDLFLYDVADATTPVATSAGTGPVEAVTVPPGGGDFFVRVNAFSGSSNYTLTLGQAGLSVPASGPDGIDAEFVPDEVIVTFEPGILPAGAADTLATRAASVGLVPIAGEAGRETLLGLGTGAARARALEALGVTVGQRALAEADPVRAARADTLAAVKALRRRPDVLRADLNFIHHPTVEPNDTHYPLQWHYPLVNLPAAWDVSTGSASVIVAVVDTGVFLAHPDLDGKLVPGHDFISDPTRAGDGNGVDANPDDPGDSATLGNSSYHGTHVAGTVAAESNSGAAGGGVAGVSWDARIMPVRVLGVGGGTSFDIINGVKWAAGLVTTPAPPAQRADVVNLSLGCQDCFSTSEQAAYADVRAAGVVIVAAAGNENSGVAGYPASYAGVVSVSAVDPLGARAPYSNFGPNVDIAAPGGDTSKDRDGNGFPDGVLSTWKDDTAVGPLQAVYRFMQGTSMASPHVAGVVALMKGVWDASCPAELTPADVDAVLSGGGMTVDAGAAGRDDVYGHGLVDALQAVQSAQTCGATLPTTLAVGPARLDFGLTTATLTLTASKNGTGALDPVGATDDAAWLEVTGPGGDGLGTWTATVGRTELADGLHTATITFTAGTSTVQIPVTLQVGGVAPGAGDVGHLYVLLTDANFSSVGQTAVNPAAGQYAFSLSDVAAGSYLLFAGTDFDNDGFICDPGEACGAYPDVAAPALLEVSGDRAGLDFTASFEISISGGSLGKAAPGGLALRPKALKVRP